MALFCGINFRQAGARTGRPLRERGGGHAHIAVVYMSLQEKANSYPAYEGLLREPHMQEQERESVLASLRHGVPHSQLQVWESPHSEVA